MSGYVRPSLTHVEWAYVLTMLLVLVGILWALADHIRALHACQAAGGVLIQEQCIEAKRIYLP